MITRRDKVKVAKVQNTELCLTLCHIPQGMGTREESQNANRSYSIDELEGTEGWRIIQSAVNEKIDPRQVASGAPVETGDTTKTSAEYEGSNSSNDPLEAVYRLLAYLQRNDEQKYKDLLYHVERFHLSLGTGRPNSHHSGGILMYLVESLGGVWFRDVYSQFKGIELSSHFLDESGSRKRKRGSQSHAQQLASTPTIHRPRPCTRSTKSTDFPVELTFLAVAYGIDFVRQNEDWQKGSLDLEAAAMFIMSRVKSWTADERGTYFLSLLQSTDQHADENDT